MGEKTRKPKQFTIHINKKTYKVAESELTGAQIKSLAGVKPTDLLEETIVQDGRSKRVAINDEQIVEMKNGLHFWTHPGGKDS